MMSFSISLRCSSEFVRRHNQKVHCQCLLFSVKEKLEFTLNLSDLSSVNGKYYHYIYPYLYTRIYIYPYLHTRTNRVIEFIVGQADQNSACAMDIIWDKRKSNNVEIDKETLSFILRLVVFGTVINRIDKDNLQTSLYDIYEEINSNRLWQSYGVFNPSV